MTEGFITRRLAPSLLMCVNPNRVKIISAEKTGVGADYWLTQKGDIRPYGVLIKEVK